MMIKESTIERILDRLESGVDDAAQEIQDFAEAQPHLMAYLTDEENEAYTEAERELLIFGALVIYQSIQDERFEPAAVGPALIEEAEGANFKLLEGGRGPFRDRLTPLFAASPEEELLAFAEDLVVSEAEEDGITKEAREPLFVSLKTVVDVLTA